jgi:DNA invertase Pin-like site-specific DNA recombinase
MKGEEKMALKAPINTHRRETTVVFDPENNEGKEYSFAIPQKKRVAAYARVSTEQDAQQNSYEAQIEYYTNYIQGKPDWEFVEIYADEGISGTSYKNRTGFNRMIEDAKAGKIDLILTKSISRFSRNTVDSLTVTRELKAKGVEVYFEKENISSMDKTAELVFTMLFSKKVK